jgi:hypothetical protein
MRMNGLVFTKRMFAGKRAAIARVDVNAGKGVRARSAHAVVSGLSGVVRARLKRPRGRIREAPAFVARDGLDDMEGPDDRDPDDSRFRFRRLAPAAVLLLVGPAIAAIAQPPSSPFYLGAYRVGVGAFVTLLGFVALWFATRDD